MKLTKLSRILVLLFCITSCSKEDIEPITLHYVENNSIDMFYPNTGAHSISIIGGDGKYSASCNSMSVLEVELVQEKKMILLKPQSIGNAIVTITDESGNSYALNVKVLYRKLNLIIDRQDVIVIGDKLSEAQKTEIQQKVALTLPVKVDGGFSFIYNLDMQRGEVSIYKDKYGENGVQSTFEEKYTETESARYRSFVIQIDGKKREFVLDRYYAPMAKSDMIVPVAFIEVLTDQFKAEYPDVESIYTQQRLISPKKEY